MEPLAPLDALRAFRGSLYRCFDRRADALFELGDAVLTAGVVPSPVHLSLEPSHRRGWGSLYAALDRGRIDEEALRGLLARHPLAGGGPPVYAVDVSVWARCDAESSPQRGYYYPPSRHSAGQPIVAGWAYQWIAQLGFARESWTAPVDMRRVRPEENANAIAAEQVKALLVRLPPPREAIPLFVFDAGYDPVQLQRGLEGRPAQILVRLRGGRCFYADPVGPTAKTGRPRRHGRKMDTKDSGTWPEPTAEHTCEEAGYGAVRVRAWAGLHPKVQAHADRGSRGPTPIARGTLVLVEVEAAAARREAARAAGSVAVVAGSERTGSGPSVARLRAALRPGAYLPLPQADFGMDHPSGAPPRAGRPVDVAGASSLHAA
jgi:DDE superfamily endonuclease